MAKGSVSLAIELPESKLLNIKCSPGGAPDSNNLFTLVRIYVLTNYSPETGHVTISPPITAQYQSIVHFCQNLWEPGTMEKCVLILLSWITSVWK